MKWSNSEMSVFLREDNLVIVKMNETVERLTVPAAEECVAKIREAMELNDEPKALLFYLSSRYISKKVMRCYADTSFGEVGAAVLCESFVAWLMGNIAITIAERFVTLNPEIDAPMKAFKEEELAIAWSLNLIKEAS